MNPLTADLMLSVVTQLATIMAAVWGLTEVLGRVTGRPKDLIALAVGPLMGLLGYVVGFVTAIPGQGWRAYVGAAFAGFVGTLVAKQFHDLIAAPLMDAFAKRGGGDPPAPPA